MLAQMRRVAAVSLTERCFAASLRGAGPAPRGLPRVDATRRRRILVEEADEPVQQVTGARTRRGRNNAMAEQDAERQLVVFDLVNETYGVGIEMVREIIRMQASPTSRTRRSTWRG